MRGGTEVEHNMPWERRQRGDKYYTRSRRIAGRRVRQYIGTGPVAELAAAIDAARYAEHRARTEERRAEEVRLAAIAAPVIELGGAMDLLTQAALVAAEFHCHNGCWRRRRDASDKRE
jgi:hypothetical protein